MITRRMGRHTALRRRIVQRKDCIGGAASLECADLLKIFAFEEQRCSACSIQARASQHQCPMDVRSNPLMRRADAIEIDRHAPCPFRKSSADLMSHCNDRTKV